MGRIAIVNFVTTPPTTNSGTALPLNVDPGRYAVIAEVDGETKTNSSVVVREGAITMAQRLWPTTQ